MIPTESNAPFGTVPRRPAWPLALWVLVYLGWTCTLLWLALATRGR